MEPKRKQKKTQRGIKYRVSRSSKKRGESFPRAPPWHVRDGGDAWCFLRGVDDVCYLHSPHPTRRPTRTRCVTDRKIPRPLEGKLAILAGWPGREGSLSLFFSIGCSSWFAWLGQLGDFCLGCLLITGGVHSRLQDIIAIAKNILHKF